ncbi:MAG: class I SAM-dependent methyltransferase [Candidatus Moranbacteria bacterium]|jgi:2-polyprenyl-3-methyl-5-hydroxy-6-metoxy-1,4-benzoquinol methylase|nr:class I SAM-dependent methyltransferase [Candidatus Moranbacteria bacterium]
MFEINRENFIQKETSDLPSETDRIISKKESAWIERSEDMPKFVGIWHSLSQGNPDFVKKLRAFEDVYNRMRKSDSVRPVFFYEKSPREIGKQVSMIAEKDLAPEFLPEIIILQKKQDEAGNKEAVDVIRSIRRNIKKYLELYPASKASGAETQEAQKEKMEWEENILQPLIVVVSDDLKFSEEAKKNGADIVMKKLELPDVLKLVELVGKIKSNPASLSPSVLNEIKTEFYGSIQEEVENRSKISAETEKELEILDEMFSGENIKSILDVGCGWGRIDLELAEKNDFLITGLDSSEYFLALGKNRLEQAEKEGVLKGKVDYRKGEIIDYSKTIESGSFDSVIYTWHSILEAYGSGNILRSLNSAWKALRPRGVLVFDQPSRETEGLEDGWYGVKLKDDEKYSYLAYIMTEEEIEFMLKVAGFEDVEIRKWTTSPNKKYPEGMKKIVVKAHKPEK